LYRFDPNQTVSRMQSNVICSNGTAWSPDGRTMYYTESFRYQIFAYDFDAATGSLANRRIFAEVDRSLGAFPDGLCVDADGGVWSNQVGIGRIVRYDPTGRVERRIEFPVPRAVGCTFGGDTLDTLFVTSAREAMTPEQLHEAPLSGSIFAVKLNVKGSPATPFGA
jgi:sugar lactone lactonase YvrE